MRSGLHNFFPRTIWNTMPIIVLNLHLWITFTVIVHVLSLRITNQSLIIHNLQSCQHSDVFALLLRFWPTNFPNTITKYCEIVWGIQKFFGVFDKYIAFINLVMVIYGNTFPVNDMAFTTFLLWRQWYWSLL